MRNGYQWRAALAVMCTLGAASAAQADANVPALEELGKRVFFDKISSPRRQACVSCHDPASGWTGRVSAVNRFQVAITGADPHTVGGRRPPSNAYASFSPFFGDAPGGPAGACASQVVGVQCKGGVFWDGRATGTNILAQDVFANDPTLSQAYGGFLGPVADQALGPFPNDVEQNVPDGADGGLPGAFAVCSHVQAARYSELFAMAWGEAIDCTPARVAQSFKRIAVALSAWQHSSEVNSFSSKRDLALASEADGAFPLAGLTDQENLGHDLFYGITSALNPAGKNARCVACHNSGAANSVGAEPKQLYTDNSFHHLGLPPNPEIANYDPAHPDFGLSQHTNPANPGASGHVGSFRTPTLRNVDKRIGNGVAKAYMHNGYFKKLEDVVHFYNTAIAKAECPPHVTSAADARANNCWPKPEFPDVGTAAPFGLFGNLGLSTSEEAALVAYMKTLSDTETVRKPSAYVPTNPAQGGGNRP